MAGDVGKEEIALFRCSKEDRYASFQVAEPIHCWVSVYAGPFVTHIGVENGVNQAIGGE